jgi:hypothetical protein
MKRIMRTNLVRRALGKSAKRVSNSGFALMDLMIGAALTTVVVAAAGYGVTSMISSSTASNSRTAIRTELSRSNDFITAEIQKGSGLVTGSLSSPAGFTTASYSGKIKTGTTPTNVLAINPQGISNPIVYFVATPATGTAKGPRALYRWGPAFNDNGTYSTTDPWVSELVVDQIQGATAPYGWTAPSCSGTLSGDYGFGACVDSLGKSAKIYQNGNISKVLGGSENYGTSTNVSSRKTTVATLPASFANGATVSTWTLNNGTVTTTSPLTMSVRYLGGAFVCGNALYPIPRSVSVTVTTGSKSTSTDVTMTPNADTSLGIVAANSTMTIAGSAKGDKGSSSCNGSTYGPILSTNTTKVKSLKNGDALPQIGGFLGQPSIDDYLTSASTNPVTSRPIVKSLSTTTVGSKTLTTGTIDLAPNQVIYLYELGGGNPGDASFDLQDIVVLATFQ